MFSANQKGGDVVVAESEVVIFVYRNDRGDISL